MKFIIVFISGYILGSIPFSFLLGKIRGVDLRKVGSGNIGATNLSRACGKGWGIAGFILDLLKGTMSVLVGYKLSSGNLNPIILGITGGVGSIVGHNWTFFLRFKGGKGVATSAGVFLGLAPFPLLAAIGVWGAVFFISGYVSLASILSAFSLPFWVYLLKPDPILLILSIITFLLIIYRHRENIKRLMNGKENRFSTIWKR